jgi:Mannosylglycerate hydrolase MGH1-like glycoside hydrolase domain
VTHPWCSLGWVLWIATAATAQEQTRAPGLVGTVELSSDFAPLVDGFAWAKRQALAYVFEGDPVGPWFEAALPGREAFCMRDVSHQTTGALVLGLEVHTKNMLRKFAVSIAESRDWCGYWEIDRLDRPAPVDYRNDEDFWYNLPANFDVVDACFRAYQWTADEDYLRRPDFDEFYRRSLLDYVSRWDANGDGLLESPASNGTRGLATYYEGDGPRVVTGADLVAAQFAASRAYARMLELQGENEAAQRFGGEASRLRKLVNDEWWNPELRRFHSSIGEGGAFRDDDVPAMQIFALYFGIVDERRAPPLLDGLADGTNVEESSYLAEAYYRHGRDEEGFRSLLTQMDPLLPRREYPENPFTAVGTTVSHLAGVHPQTSDGALETRSRLPERVSWIRVQHLPLLDRRVTVEQHGRRESRLTNESGPPLIWQAVFFGDHRSLVVDGVTVDAERRRSQAGEEESYVRIEVASGRTRVVRIPEP